MENLICVTGPRGAGKETVLNTILSSTGGLFTRIVPFTTRAKRESEEHGREYFFISKERYLKAKRNKYLTYSVQIGRSKSHYFTGTLQDEFDKHENGIIDITVEGARVISRYAKNSLLLYVYASPEERCRRIMARQNISEVEALALMANEPSPGTLETINALYPEFTILHNNDGVHLESLVEPVYEFLGASVLA